MLPLEARCCSLVLVFGLPLAVMFGGCAKKEPTPTAATSETSRKVEEEPLQPLGKAYPPGQAPSNDPAPPKTVEVKTGVCSFRETGYDGQDTKFAENLVVKIRRGHIVIVKYSYKGGYATEGDDETLDVPLKEDVWVPFSINLSNGRQEFKVRVKGDRFRVKGTAVQDAESSCTWIDESGAAPSASASAKPAPK